MTQHRHPVTVPGCYRCELSREEEREIMREHSDFVDRMGQWKAVQGASWPKAMRDDFADLPDEPLAESLREIAQRVEERTQP